MTKRKLALAALLSVTALGGAAIAADTLASPRGPLRADSNGDGVVSRSEFFAAAEARFKRRDTDGDRTLAGDEIGHRRRGGTDAARAVTFAQLSQWTAARFARLDANGDGKLAGDELAVRRGRGGRSMGHGFGMLPGGGLRAGALARLDVDRDGRITRAELHARADRRFDRLDANRDGAIDRAELRALRIGGGGRGRLGSADLPPPPAPARDR